MDRVTKEQRSKNMAAVKSSGNKSTEALFVKILRSNKIKGWRRKLKLYGKPDFTFPNKKTVIFIDGCFWHGCKLHRTIPKTNQVFWQNKISRNENRDAEVNLFYQKCGWKVLRFWEHEIQNNSEDLVTLLKNKDSNL